MPRGVRRAVRPPVLTCEGFPNRAVRMPILVTMVTVLSHLGARHAPPLVPTRRLLCGAPDVNELDTL